MRASAIRAGSGRPAGNGVGVGAAFRRAWARHSRGDLVFVTAGQRYSCAWRVGFVLALSVVVTAFGTGAVVEIVRKAAQIPEKAQGLDGFVNAANALVSPALVAMAAVAPLGCVVGAGALMFGSRRGMVIIGASLGTLVFLGSVKGIVA